MRPLVTRSIALKIAAALLLAALSACTGGVVSNQSIVWSSSVPTVAVATASGTLIALGAGNTVVTAATGGQSGTVSIDVAFGAIIGTQGGAFTAAGGNLKLSLPVASLAAATGQRASPSRSISRAVAPYGVIR